MLQRIKSSVKNYNTVITGTVLFIIFLAGAFNASAQAVLFDFDNAPLHSPFPINQTVNNITVRFSATGQGYSIQDNSSPVVPQGFTGRYIYPSSIYLSDLLIKFDQTISDFSIWYSCQELGCDDAATMRVSAYMAGASVGTNTRTAANPGTWPVDILSCSFSSGFDSVVVHYDSHPPTCQDYGVIFLADNMRVTALNTTAITEPEMIIDGIKIQNPVSGNATISFSLLKATSINAGIYDLSGKLIRNLFKGNLSAGEHKLNWDVNDDAIESGLYYLNLSSNYFSKTCKLVVVK